MEQVFKIELPIEATGAEKAISEFEKVDEAIGHVIDKNGRLRDVHGRFVKMGDGAEQAAKAIKDTGKSSTEAGKKTDSAFGKAGQSVDKFSQRVEKTNRSLRAAFREKLQLTIAAIDRASPILKEIWSAAKSLGSKAWNVTLKAVDFITTPIKNAISLLGKLTGVAGIASSVLGGLSIKNSLSESAEQARMNAQLAVSARNMGINEAGINAINAQASALQGRTMYSDTAMTGAAAELATYFEDANAITRMMSTVADYAAGMSGGVELTTEQIVDYTTNLAKMTTGAYDAMTKKGFEVTDAQKKILETGEDMAKVAVIEEIIKENWEGMAEAMAKTPTGLITQMKNEWSDMAELFGDKLTPRATEFLSIIKNKMPRIGEFIEKGTDAFLSLIDNALPHVEGVIDGILNKAEGFMDMTSSLFGSADFQNADLFGKLSLSWNKLVAEPFDEWWSGEGQAKVVGFAGEIGNTFGETLKGIFLGAASLLTGQDFMNGEGLQLTGMAQAGLEIGSSFASSFMEAIQGALEQLPNIISGIAQSAFGGGGMSLLSGLLVGKGALAAGSGIAKTVKTFNGLKTALFGVKTTSTLATATTATLGKTAVTAGVGIGKTTALLGGLKTVLAAIPVWGWVAAGAITATAVGVKLYADAQERERQELLHTGDAVEEAAENLRSASEKVNQFDSLMGERKKIERIIKIAREGLSDDELTALEDRLAAIEDEEKTLTLNLNSAGLTIVAIEDYVKRFSAIDDQKKTLFASVISIATPGADDILTLMKDYNDAGLPESEKKEIEARMMAYGSTKEKAEEILALMKEYNNADLSPYDQAMVLASLVATCTNTERAETILSLMEKYAAAELVSDKAEIEAELIATCENEDEARSLLSLFKQYDALKGEEKKITAELTTSMPEGTDIAQIVTDLQTLAALSKERDEIKLTLDAANLDPETLIEYEEKLASINAALIESSGGLITQYDIENGRLEDKLVLLEQHLALQREIARLALKDEVMAGRETTATQAAKRDEYYQSYTDSKAVQDELSDKRSNMVLVQDEIMALQKERSIAEKEMPYADYLDWSLNGDFDARQNDAMQRYLANGGTEAGWTAAWGGDMSAFTNDLDRISKEEADQAKRTAQHQQDYLTQQESLMKQYQGEQSLIVAETFKGTDHEGKSLSELAEMYNTMNTVEREMFRQAMEQFREFNAGVDYLDPAEKTLTTDLWKIAYNSESATPGTEESEINARQAIGNLRMMTVTNEAKDTYFTQLLKDNEAAYAAAQEQQDTDAMTRLLSERKNIFNDQYDAILNAQKAVNVLDEKIAAAWEQLSEAQARGGQITGAKETVEEVKLAYGGMSDTDRIAFKDSAEGAAALQTVNTALESLSLEKIASLDELSAAMERINTAGTENDNAIASISESLQALTSDKVEALIAIEDGLGTMAFNAERLSESNLDDALKVSKDNVDRFGKLETTFGNIRSRVDETKGSLDSLAGDYAVDVTVTYLWKQVGSQPRINTSVSGYAPNIGERASGGLVSKAELSWIGEAGPEMVIPLSAARHDRGLDLWYKAGEMLGVNEYANGGIVAPYVNSVNALPNYRGEDDDSDPFPVFTGGGSSSPVFTIQIEANPVYHIEGDDADDIMEKIKGHEKELAEVIAFEFAGQLEEIDSNM